MESVARPYVRLHDTRSIYHAGNNYAIASKRTYGREEKGGDGPKGTRDGSGQDEKEKEKISREESETKRTKKNSKVLHERAARRSPRRTKSNA